MNCMKCMKCMKKSQKIGNINIGSTVTTVLEIKSKIHYCQFDNLANYQKKK